MGLLWPPVKYQHITGWCNDTKYSDPSSYAYYMLSYEIVL